MERDLLECRAPNAGHGLRKGEAVPAHVHANPHRAVFANGTWLIKRKRKRDYGGRMEWPLEPDVSEIREAPFTILVPAGEWHEFEFLGQRLPGWMEGFLATLEPELRDEFRALYEGQLGFVHCIFPGEAA